MTNLDDIADVLRAAGVTVHETPGWDTRGYAGQDLKAVRGVLWHHTATNRSQFAGNPAPTLGMCINGRSDLPGPLCNLVFDRNGHIWTVATGVANHAGAGSAPGIPKDMGNHYLIGIEAESSGIAPWDWTPAQLQWAPIIGAALERHYLAGLPEAERLHLGHMEYSSQGKIDPAGWPGGMDGLRASINAALQNPTIAAQGTITQEDELSAQDVEALQVINNQNADRVILDNRAQLRALGDELVKKINDESYEMQLWDQKTDNQTGDRIIDALRADIGAMSPSTIASLIPANIAQAVATELAKRLVK